MLSRRKKSEPIRSSRAHISSAVVGGMHRGAVSAESLVLASPRTFFPLPYECCAVARGQHAPSSILVEIRVLRSASVSGLLMCFAHGVMIV